MTIADNYVPLKQLGNGVTTQFSGTWPMLNATYAQVFLQDSTSGVQTPVSQGPGANQYQIALTSTAFTVTFGAPPLGTQYAVIGRSTARSQTTPYTTSGGFQGANEEFSYDKLTAMQQENVNTLARAIVAPLADTASMILPSAAARANQFLLFDSSGNVSVASGVANVPVSAAMVPVVEAVTTAAALTLLGGQTAAQVTTAINAAVSTTNPTIQIFTSGSGTYTRPAGVKWLRVRQAAGGGGGGGSAGAGVGNGGTGGTGGNTTFGTSLLTCNGGGGAAGSQPNGQSTATISAPAIGLAISGSSGGPGVVGNGGTYGTGACGGMNAFGGSGNGTSTSQAGGVAPPNTGGGGGGASGPTTAQSNGGGGGTAGAFIDAIIPNPAATYSYAVGAGGTAGAAGTNGFIGGVGVAGQIIVEEHYNS